MYFKGHGVPESDLESVKWYRRAADQAHPGAQCQLGDMYLYGQGVPKDIVAAYMWFSLSAARGNSQAGEYRDNLAREMKPAQIAEAKARAEAWRPTS